MQLIDSEFEGRNTMVKLAFHCEYRLTGQLLVLASLIFSLWRGSRGAGRDSCRQFLLIQIDERQFHGRRGRQ